MIYCIVGFGFTACNVMERTSY